jgi:5-hydroxyisourate hydrolase
MSKITTHVLDTVLGKPAAAIAVRLERHELDRRHAGRWAPVSAGETSADGRCGDLAQNAPAGTYRLTFATGAYFERNGRASIYPEISIVFICNGDLHYHLPLLLSENSYTTYRGS